MASTVFPAPSAGVTQKVQEFTSTGTFTAPSNCYSVEVFLVGAGGGGGGFPAGNPGKGGGGGGGEVITSRKISVTPGTSYTVTIGAGGAGGAANTGAVGNDSSFGSLLTAYGGGGGSGRLSNGNGTNPSIKATPGGTVVTDGNPGVGGGGAFPIFIPDQSTTPFTGQNQTYLSVSGVFSGGMMVNTNGNKWPGMGIDGFGGGGQGGTASGSTVSLNAVSFHGGGISTAENAAGGNGTANKGGGGAGASKANTTTAYNGGNGGSGYALVTYWS